MPDLTPRQTKALLYWGTIQRAASEHMSTADLWAAIRQQSGTVKGEPIGFTAADISTLRGYAGRIEQRAQALGALARGDAITSDVIGLAPYARGLDQRNATPEYHVRFVLTTVDSAGNQDFRWATSRYRGTLPPTMADLMDSITNDAIGIAQGYQLNFAGLDSVQILEV